MLQKYYQVAAAVAFLVVLCTAQIYQQPTAYDPYKQYNYNTNPTFSNLNTYSGYYTTAYPSYGNTVFNNALYPAFNTGSNPQIRIWPYVIGQYLYPFYYNSNANNPYTNWPRYNTNAYRSLGKK